MSSESENEHYEGEGEEEEEDNYSEGEGEEVDSEEDENAAKLLEEEEKSIKEQLKHASFETIMKIKQRQKEIDEQLKQKKDKGVKKSNLKKPSIKQSTEEFQSKRSKGAPIERNAKKPVSVFQTVVQTKKQKGRDPRFDQLSGELNQTYFDNSYGFINDMKKKEAQILSKEVKKKKFTSEEKQVLKNELGKIKGELKLKEYNDKKQKVMQKYKDNAKKSIEQGSLPYFAKKAQIKEDILRMQYDSLKGTNKLQNVLKRKRKQQSDMLMSAYHLITNKKVKKE